MSDLFDWNKGQQEKREGMAIAAEHRPSDLDLARQIAREIAAQYGTVHADQVGRVLKRRYGIDSLGPAAGSLFKGKEWEFTGERTTSARVSNHGRELKIWRLK